MNRRLQWAVGVLVAVCIGALVWLWFEHLELRWEARDRVSQAAAENRMLGATLLLRQRGYAVALTGSLGSLDLRTVPDGTLIIGNEHGVTTPESAQLLLAWVRRGNTLVTSPRWAGPGERAPWADGAGPGDEDDEPADKHEEKAGPEPEPASDQAPAPAPQKAPQKAPDQAQAEAPAGAANMQRKRRPGPPALVEIDPLAARYGVRRTYLKRLPRCSKKHEDATAGTDYKHTNCIPAKDYTHTVYRLELPRSDYPLTLDEGLGDMFTMPGAGAPLWGDDKAEVLRVYREGKGQVVFMAGNYFTNSDLNNFDHAELLLALTSLNPSARSVTVVKSLDVLPWYKALWRSFHYLLVALAVSVALLFWMAVRRFGPMLAQPAIERRSLMEHIAASGAWLWQAEGGRELLLGAAREETLALLRRRVPALFRLPSHQLPAALARDSGLDSEQLLQALHDDAARQPTRFTRQIRTLQELRNHYER